MCGFFFDIKNVIYQINFLSLLRDFGQTYEVFFFYIDHGI